MRKSRSSGLATRTRPAASPAAIMNPRKMRLICVMRPPASSGRARRSLAERRLRGGKPRDRNAERRTRHVVEPDLVAERHGCRIAAMLAANAELERVTRLAAAIGCDADQLADTVAVERNERIDGQNALRLIGAEEARRVV